MVRFIFRTFFVYFAYNLNFFFFLEDNDPSKFNFDVNAKISDGISVLIDRHTFCLELTEKIRKLFAEIIFLHFASAAFIICLSSIDLMFVSKNFRFY